MADADSNNVETADEASGEQTEIASAENDTECGKVSGSAESGDQLPSDGVTADDKMGCETSVDEKMVKPEETVKSVTTNKSNITMDGMECGKKRYQLKCVDTTSENREELAASAEAVSAYSELKDEMACEDAAGKSQSEESKRSLKESEFSPDAKEKSTEESTQVAAFELGAQKPYSPGSGELADHSDSLSSTSSERTRPEDENPVASSMAGILKPAILSFLPVTNSKAEEKLGASAVSKTSENSNSFVRSSFPEDTKPKELVSHGMVIDDPKPKEWASHGMVINDPKPDDSKHVLVQDESHVELVVMKEAEVDLEGSPKEKSATSAVPGCQPEQERSSVELPMEQDGSEAVPESMPSDAEEPCSHDGGKRRMESSDEGPCVSPLKRRNQKLEDTL